MIAFGIHSESAGFVLRIPPTVVNLLALSRTPKPPFVKKTRKGILLGY